MQAMNNMGALSRADFLKGLGLVGVAAGTSAFLSSCSSNTGGSQELSSGQEWDEEVDVVVIGSGTGVYTALRANQAGLKTLVLEKGDTAGGSTLYSTSVVWVPNNEVMKEKGDTDSREEVLTYIEEGSAETYLPEMAEAFVDTINIAATNVTELTGVEWEYWAGGIDYRSSLPGGKEIGRALIPVVEEGASTAGALQSAFLKAAKAEDIEIRVKTPALELITRDDGEGNTEVIGVIAGDEGNKSRIKATTAVVMAAGGFDWNDDMMANYLRLPVQYSWGVATATGDAHKMAMRAGCDMRFMNQGWLSPGYKEQHEEAKQNKMARFASAITDYGKPGLIYVNKHGKRFTNECSNYDSLARSFCAIENGFEPRGWQNLPAYAIADQTAVEKYNLGGGEPGVPGLGWQSYDSLEDLAQALDIDAGSLENTVQVFNENAAQGLDPDFGRGQDYFGQNYQRVDMDFEGPARTLGQLTSPPFWAAEVVPVVLGTMGGIKTNEKSQAIDMNGKIISRLYAHGNAAGHGCGGAFYACGGGTLGPSLAFGELAATDIASLTSWE